LRFPEFSGEWDSERLENLTVSIGDGLHSTPVYCEQGDYCFINGNNIIDGKVSINEKTLRVTKEEAYKYNAALLKVDTILMSINGTIGNVALYNGENIMLGKSACYINPSSRIVREYLFHILSSPRIQAYFQGEVTGTTIKNLSLRTIRGSKILLPSNEEQKKIARLFSLVDERIATQNKIIEKLESLIKGIAQNVARNNKPNIRLSECLEYSSSTLQESDVCENGTYLVYGANGIVGYIDNYNTEKEAVYIIKDGSGVGTVSYVTGKCSATGTLNTLQAKEGYSLQYLYYMLKVFNFEPYKTGMAIPHIYFKDYGKAKIFCPSYTEQLKYVELLSAIDNKLSAEQSILTDLSLQKQYLLSQMFI
jgi:restriction endonuclease, S subunit